MMNERELMSVLGQGTTYNNDDLHKWLMIGEIREESNQVEIIHELSIMKIGSILGCKVAYTKDDINWDILSELGNRACAELDVDLYCHVYFKEKDNVWSYSLRSLNGQALKMINESMLKGGGHEDACGFKDVRYLIEEK